MNRAQNKFAVTKMDIEVDSLCSLQTPYLYLWTESSFIRFSFTIIIIIINYIYIIALKTG